MYAVRRLHSRARSYIVRAAHVRALLRFRRFSVGGRPTAAQLGRPCALRLCSVPYWRTFAAAFSSRAFSRAACRAVFLSIRAAFVCSTASAAYCARAFFAADVRGLAFARAERVRLPRSLGRAIEKGIIFRLLSPQE